MSQLQTSTPGALRLERPSSEEAVRGGKDMRPDQSATALALPLA